MNSDDIENLTRLIQEAARGNRAAFEELYRQTSPRLYSVALQTVPLTVCVPVTHAMKSPVTTS